MTTSRLPITIPQASHVKAMARKLRNHALEIEAMTRALQEENLVGLPLKLMTDKLAEIEMEAATIQQIFTDMRPRLEELTR